MRNKIINDLYRGEFIEALLSKITSDSQYKEDLKQELFLILLEMEDIKVIKAYEEKYLNYLCVNILKKQFHSSTSPFFKKYRKRLDVLPTDILTDDYDHGVDDKVELINKILDKYVSFTDRELFRLYYKMGKYDRWLGPLRDKSCDKPMSTTRKIEKKLTLKGHVPGKKKVTIAQATVWLSINRARTIVKEKLKEEYGYDIDL